MPMCLMLHLSNSQDEVHHEDSVSMCLSNSQGVCQNHKMQRVDVSFEIYAPQTKMLEGRTNRSECVSTHFQRFLAQIEYSQPLKSASKTHSERLVRPSKLFVWEG